MFGLAEAAPLGANLVYQVFSACMPLLLDAVCTSWSCANVLRKLLLLGQHPSARTQEKDHLKPKKKIVFLGLANLVSTLSHTQHNTNVHIKRLQVFC